MPSVRRRQRRARDGADEGDATPGHGTPPGASSGEHVEGEHEERERKQDVGVRPQRDDGNESPEPAPALAPVAHQEVADEGHAEKREEMRPDGATGRGDERGGGG